MFIMFHLKTLTSNIRVETNLILQILILILGLYNDIDCSFILYQ